MDPARVQFLFGVDRPEFDVDNEGEVLSFSSRRRPAPTPTTIFSRTKAHRPARGGSVR
jgi:hypothetical protein